MTIVAVLGFPKSGKSTWLAQQYNTLRSQGRSFFVQRACPDGEGHWTFESENGKALRVKGKFDPAFVAWVKESALGLAKTFKEVYLDCGGRQSAENAEILQVADAAIIIGRNLEDLESWANWVKSIKPMPITFYLSSLTEGGEVRYQEVVLDESRV
jgi:CRISPR-associated protein Csx3